MTNKIYYNIIKNNDKDNKNSEVVSLVNNFAIGLKSLDFIEYKKAEPFLRRWLQHHLRRKNIRLRVRAHIMDVQGLAKFILSDLGAGILPDHLVKKLKQEGHELYVFEGKGSPLINEIQLVQVKNFKLGSAAKFTFDQLQQLL